MLGFYYLLAPSNIFKMCCLITTKPQKDKRKKGINFVLGLCEQTREKGKSHTAEKVCRRNFALIICQAIHTEFILETQIQRGKKFTWMQLLT